LKDRDTHCFLSERKKKAAESRFLNIYERRQTKPRTTLVRRYTLLSLGYPMSEKSMGDSGQLSNKKGGNQGKLW